MAKKLPYKLFRDFRIPKGGDEGFFREAADYIPRKGDVFIVSYPKCGTTWMQHIVYLLMKRGEPADSISQVISSIPFPEQDGFQEDVTHIALKYHLPFRLLRHSEEALYIYVARNPKDACVSYYHFLKKLPGYHIESFDDFFEAFLEGQLAYGDFSDHVSGWFDVRHLPNVLFVTYETLSCRRKETVLKVASFLGLDELDEITIDSVLKYSSFEFMKSLAEKDAFMRQYLTTSTHLPSEEKEAPKMMRRGRVGDWKHFFSEEQSRRMSQYLESRNTSLMNLWRKDMED